MPRTANLTFRFSAPRNESDVFLKIDEESVSLKEKLAAFQEAQADFDACSAQFKEKTEEMEKARNDRLEFVRL